MASMEAWHRQWSEVIELAERLVLGKAALPTHGTQVMGTRMAPGYEPPSGSLNPAASVSSDFEERAP